MTAVVLPSTSGPTGTALSKATFRAFARSTPSTSTTSSACRTSSSASSRVWVPGGSFTRTRGIVTSPASRGSVIRSMWWCAPRIRDLRSPRFSERPFRTRRSGRPSRHPSPRRRDSSVVRSVRRQLLFWRWPIATFVAMFASSADGGVTTRALTRATFEQRQDTARVATPWPICSNAVAACGSKSAGRENALETCQRHQP